MNTTTIYKEDSTKESWECILNDLGLPSDTDEICIKHITHMTKTKREQLKKDSEAHENKKMQYNVCETCGASDGKAGLLIKEGEGPEECVNCSTTRTTGEVFIDTSLLRTEEEIKKTIAIIK